MEKSIPMSKIETTISDLRLEPASNGVILTWCERKRKEGAKDTYENTTYDYPKEVYDFESGAPDAEQSAIDKAMGRFKDLWMMQYAEYKNKKS